MEENLDLVVASAIRYALGRKTYIVSVICEFTEKHLKDFDEKILISIKNDICSCHNLGNECDENNWRRLLMLIEEELINRKKD